MNITECKVGQRVSATYSVFTNRLGTIVDVRGGRAEVRFDDGFSVRFSHRAAEFLSLIAPRVFKTGQRVSFPDPLTRQTVNGRVVNVSIDRTSIVTEVDDDGRGRIRAAFDVSDERVQPIEAVDDGASKIRVGQCVSATYLSRVNRLGVVSYVGDDFFNIRFDDSEVDMPFTDGHVKDGFVKLIDESEATPKKVGIGSTRCPFGSRPTLDDLTDMWNAASVETSCYTSVISQPEWRYDRRRATPFIWSPADGVETAHIVDGVSGVYFMVTVARISDDSFKWTTHENKRLMRIGFSSDLKTAKEDAEKFCRERMAVHRESKETK